jgi:hypothetical protein
LVAFLVSSVRRIFPTHRTVKVITVCTITGDDLRVCTTRNISFIIIVIIIVIITSIIIIIIFIIINVSTASFLRLDRFLSFLTLYASVKQLEREISPSQETTHNTQDNIKRINAHTDIHA